MKKIKNWWYSRHRIFTLSCWLGLDGLHINFVILDNEWRVNLELPTFVRSYGWFRFYAKDAPFGRPLSSLNLELGLCPLLETGFTIKWEAHDYGCARMAAIGVLGAHAELTYWNGLGWDSDRNEYFVLKGATDGE